MGETNNVDHASIPISNLTKKLTLCRKSPSYSQSCIFKVPETLRLHNEKVFDPKVVSIGPFHHGKDRLVPMEKIKLWYLRCLLDRLPQPLEKTSEHFVKSIGKLQTRARECYAESINCTSDEFNEMMVVDGCFLIKLFREDPCLKYEESVPGHEDDPVFRMSWMRENLYHDLILLENQIPWFVLERLFELTKSAHEKETHFLHKLVLGFFDNRMLMTLPTEYNPREGREIKHILDLLRSCLLSSSVDIKPERTGWHRLPPVTDLLQAGIKFKSGTRRDIFNIEFTKNGMFEIPPISIQSNSESLFRNLIAYEQYGRNCTYQFTSYAVFLDYLINTSKDVDVLYDEKILRHELSTEDISRLFNRLYNDTLVYDFYYAGVSRDVYKYYKSRWPKWRTTFKRDYFKNPWRISSFVAAILVLLFTCTQTVMAIIAYLNVPFN